MTLPLTLLLALNMHASPANAATPAVFIQPSDDISYIHPIKKNENKKGKIYYKKYRTHPNQQKFYNPPYNYTYRNLYNYQRHYYDAPYSYGYNSPYSYRPPYNGYGYGYGDGDGYVYDYRYDRHYRSYDPLSTLIIEIID